MVGAKLFYGRDIFTKMIGAELAMGRKVQIPKWRAYFFSLVTLRYTRLSLKEVDHIFWIFLNVVQLQCSAFICAKFNVSSRTVKFESSVSFLKLFLFWSSRSTMLCPSWSGRQTHKWWRIDSLYLLQPILSSLAWPYQSPLVMECAAQRAWPVAPGLLWGISKADWNFLPRTARC